MGDGDDTRQNLLLIKELLVDPLTDRMSALDKASTERHIEVMGKLKDLDDRSFSIETATSLRAMAEAGNTGMLSGSRKSIVKTALMHPAVPWIVTIVLVMAGLLLSAIIFTGHSVNGVIGPKSTL